MIAALVSGSLFRSPETRTSKNGTPFVKATIKAYGESMQFVSLMAFSEGAKTEPLRLKEGGSVSVQGQLKAEIYAKDGGEAKVSLSLFADHVVALRQPWKERP